MISTFDKHLCRFCLYMYKDHDCTLFGAREERQLGSLRRQRIVLRLADALIVTDSPLVIRVEIIVVLPTSLLPFASQRPPSQSSSKKRRRKSHRSSPNTELPALQAVPVALPQKPRIRRQRLLSLLLIPTPMPQENWSLKHSWNHWFMHTSCAAYVISW